MRTRHFCFPTANHKAKETQMRSWIPVFARQALHTTGGTSSRLRAALRTLLPALALAAFGSHAVANTLTQNVSWTIDRAGTSTKYRG
jgi:hypothetical protein